MKLKLTIERLIKEAKEFCERESEIDNKKLFGITDGKAVGTFIEHKFTNYLVEKYDVLIGSSANGIDMPAEDIDADIKVTSIEQPQSSCPFKNARQKIYALGYNLFTKTIRQMIDNNANTEDIIAYLIDRNLPADEITMRNLAEEILHTKPEQGYLTVSNALQWRLQYGRIVKLTESVEGIVRIVNKI